MSIPEPEKKRSWLLFALAAIVLLAAIAFINMWREALEVETLNQHLPNVVLPPVQVVNQQQKPGRVIHAETSASFLLPAGWKPIERPGKPVAYIGPTRSESTPSLQIQRASYNGSLQEKVRMETAFMKQVWADMKLVEETDCQTRHGLKGYKVVIKRKMTDKEMQHRYYFFPWQPGQCLMVLGTSSDVFGNELDALFDEWVMGLEQVNQSK